MSCIHMCICMYVSTFLHTSTILQLDGSLNPDPWTINFQWLTSWRVEESYCITKSINNFFWQFLVGSMKEHHVQIDFIHFVRLREGMEWGLTDYALELKRSVEPQSMVHVFERRQICVLRYDQDISKSGLQIKINKTWGAPVHPVLVIKNTKAHRA